MTQYVITIIDKVVPLRTNLRLTDDELNYETEKSKCKKIDDEIIWIQDDYMSIPEIVCKPSDIDIPDFLDYEAS